MAQPHPLLETRLIIAMVFLVANLETKLTVIKMIKKIARYLLYKFIQKDELKNIGLNIFIEQNFGFSFNKIRKKNKNLNIYVSDFGDTYEVEVDLKKV